MKKSSIILISLLLCTSLVLAADLGLQVDKQEYSVGENITYTVILLENDQPISDSVDVIISDVLDRQTIENQVTTNQENTLIIKDNFFSGFWKIKATYGEQTTEVGFSVKENTNVKFSIQDSVFTIKNNGNTPYIKTIQIVIGDKATSQKMNIKVGGEKSMRLVAPEGIYDIKITDGENTISKQSITLTGTGQAIGAIDENLIRGNSPIGGGGDPETEDWSFLNNGNLVAWLFIGAVGGLAILLLVERTVNKKRKRK